MYFTVTIDGRQIHSVENTDPRTFTAVRVLPPGSNPAADASYKNLVWENIEHSFNIGTKVKRNKQIGRIDTWGPFYRVSVDLVIHSHFTSQDSSDLSNILTFYAFNTDISVLSIYLSFHSGLQIVQKYSVNDINRHHKFEIPNDELELDHWYNIIIEQKSVHKKVKTLTVRHCIINNLQQDPNIFRCLNRATFI